MNVNSAIPAIPKEGGDVRGTRAPRYPLLPARSDGAVDLLDGSAAPWTGVPLLKPLAEDLANTRLAASGASEMRHHEASSSLASARLSAGPLCRSAHGAWLIL